MSEPQSGILLGPRKGYVEIEGQGSRIGTITVFAWGLVHIADNPQGYPDLTVSAKSVRRIGWDANEAR